MAQATKIEWSDVTWGPVHGCSRVSTGCLHCYAETLSLRYRHTLKPWTARNAGENVLLKPHKLREPLSKAKAWVGLGAAAAAAGKTEGKLVFVNSMSDLFHEQIPDEYILQVFTVMRRAEQHTFQVLTKRPERMREFTRRLAWRTPTTLECDDRSLEPWRRSGFQAYLLAEPIPRGSMQPHVCRNVWLGVSIENRKWVGRADVLRATPAAVRFISAEPLLGPLIAKRAHLSPVEARDLRRRRPDAPLVGEAYWADGHAGPELDLTGIDWLIVGGESGSGHRPLDLQWARDLRDAATASGTAYFLKQTGGSRPGTNLEDLPEDLCIREFPAARP